MPENAVEMIDYFLARWSGREIVAVSEVSDLLLDLRLMVAVPIVLEDHPSVEMVS